MIQIIKLILKLHKDNPAKYKMPFCNDDSIYEGKKLLWSYVKKVISL